MNACADPKREDSSRRASQSSGASVHLRDEARQEVGRVGRPLDIAPAILFLASDESSWITGTTLVVDGGATISHPPIG